MDANIAVNIECLYTTYILFAPVYMGRPYWRSVIIAVGVFSLAAKKLHPHGWQLADEYGVHMSRSVDGVVVRPWRALPLHSKKTEILETKGL